MSLSPQNGEILSDDPGEEGSQSISTIHPLLIPHIVENICQFLFSNRFSKQPLSLPEVLTSRLVCKCWNTISTQIYRKSSEEIGFGDDNHPDTSKLRRFLHKTRHSFNSPFTKFRFDPAFFIPENEPLFKDFLHSQSSFITVLKIWVDNQCQLTFPKRCYPHLSLPSLDFLFFGCANYRGRSSISRLEATYLFEALLQASSGLKRLCFSFPPKDMKSQKTIITRFGDLISKKVPRSVRNLKIEMQITDAQLEALIQIGLSLDTLHCDFRGSKLSTNILHNLLSQQRRSLQEMRLLDSEIRYDFQLDFPRFEKLTVFEIQGGHILPFSYRDKFPVLEKLLVFGWENAETLKGMFGSETECKSVVSLELPYKIVEPSLVKMASKCFPNLKRLEITPTENGMEALIKVFECLEQLEELEITFPFIIDEQLNVDEVFTGIPKEDCDTILNSCKDKKLSEGLELVKLVDFQRRSAITNLRKLKNLTIQDHSNEIRLTDITAYFGLLKMESLKNLEVGRFEISDEVFELLQEKFQFTQGYESSDSEVDSDLSDSSGSEDE